MTQPTSVYQYFDAKGVLLYVGVTSRGIARNREHNSSKAWWGYVESQTVEHFKTTKQALRRETELIRKGHPPFNVQQNRFHAEQRAFYLKYHNAQPLAAARTGRLFQLNVESLTNSQVLLAGAVPEGVRIVGTTDKFQIANLAGSRFKKFYCRNGWLVVDIELAKAKPASSEALVTLAWSDTHKSDASIKRIDWALDQTA